MMETVVAVIAGGLCLIPFYVFGPNILRASKFMLRGVGATVLGGSAVLIGLVSVIGGAMSILSIIALILGCYVLWHEARKRRHAPKALPAPSTERTAT